MVKLKRIITFTKLSRKKIKIKTRLKNRIPSIWFEEWNWKSLKFLQNVKGKKNSKNEDHNGEYNI
jgi:hypothetical protein